MVRTSLQFAQIAGTGEEETSISAKARGALERIGRSYNRRRVRKFGVRVEDEPVAVTPELDAPMRADQAAVAQAPARPAIRRSRKGARSDQDSL